MPRITVQQFADSRAAQALGFCNNNILALCSYLNEATERLLNCFAETGPWGCWDKLVFNVNRTDPYLTLPAKYARAVNMDLCRIPLRVNNEWTEVLFDGIGLQKFDNCNRQRGVTAAFDRGNVPTAYDLPASNQYVRLYLTDTRDVGASITFAGAKDQNDNMIYATNGNNTVVGFSLSLASPFVTSSFIVTSFENIEKPVTFGDVVLKAVDATSGEETFLARYLARETNPTYRRYYLNALPCGCCEVPDNPEQLQITAMCKVEYVPTCQPTDLLLIGCIPALKEECLSIRYSEMDTPNAIQMAAIKHREAVKLLNQQMAHYEGTEQPAVNLRPQASIGLVETWNLGMQ